MSDTGYDVRRLYFAVLEHRGAGLRAAVLDPWRGRHGEALREALVPLARYGGWRRQEYEFGDLLETAYALSRVSDLLLLGFQPEPPPGEQSSWQFNEPDGTVPELTAAEYLEFFGALGMTAVTPAAGEDFDPFLHEIAGVEQDPDPTAPIRPTAALWPGLMLGEMLFARAGVRVRAGTDHAVAGVADCSTLHDSYLRRHRFALDESFGWGTNSQWKTDFRRDYRTAAADHLNVDGDREFGEEPQKWGRRPDIPLDLEASLLRNRCLLVPFRADPDEGGEPGQSTGSGDSEPGPAAWRMTIPRS